MNAFVADSAKENYSDFTKLSRLDIHIVYSVTINEVL